MQIYEDPKNSDINYLLTANGERDFTLLGKRKILETFSTGSDSDDSVAESLELHKSNDFNIWKVDLGQLKA